MKKICFIVLSLAYAVHASAQGAEDSVKAVINKMFTAMKNSDAGSFQECFADSAILQTIAGNGKIRTEDIRSFVNQVGTLPKGAADERITFDVVKVDDRLAIAWTPYLFYFNDKFSHCGVNSFQLVRINGNWKIQYIIDTRRKQGCLSAAN